MRTEKLVIPAVVGLCMAASSAQSDELSAMFQDPPVNTRPRCYWYWMDGQMTLEGITRDLEAMQRVGIGQAYIGIIAGQAGNPPERRLPALTDDWWRCIEHAIREGGRTGVDIGLFNAPGWSQSGGPWVRADQAMRYVVFSEMRLRGPQRFEGVLPDVPGAVQDLAVLAFPAPNGEGMHLPIKQRTSTQIRFEAESAFTARTITVHLIEPVNVAAELQASNDGHTFRTVKRFVISRTNMAIGVGPVPLAPVVETFPAVTARHFRLVLASECRLGEIELSAAARVERISEKSLLKVYEAPLPPFDFYTWQRPNEPEPGDVLVSPAEVKDISHLVSRPAQQPQVRNAVYGVPGDAARSRNVTALVQRFLNEGRTDIPVNLITESGDPAFGVVKTLEVDVLLGGQLKRLTARDGETLRLTGPATLAWDVPEGEWTILRAALAPTGTQNTPAPPEATGLEVDKMNREALQAHFNSYVGELLRRLPESERTAWKHVVADSYETGPQNWTDAFAEDFQRRYGYDPLPWLPVLSGRVVASADQSDRFLWDLRRLVADRIAQDYVGGLRDLCSQHGLRLWLENYGHWGFPAEFLQYGGASHEVSGEFWVDGDLGSVELRAAASAAHVYGKPVVWAEAFTGGPAFRNAPRDLKARGDWSFCEGVNQFVFHVNIHQPWDHRVPGVNAWFGTEFNRHNTWFEDSKTWIEYLRRCSVLLQTGQPVADVAYFITEDTPKMTGLISPKLPSGRDFDFINAEVIQRDLAVQDGVLCLPHGVRYRVLVLPESPTMRPELLSRIRELVRDGATVVGKPPSRSPSLQGYPDCDRDVRTMARELWGDGPFDGDGEHQYGRGRVVWGRDLDTVLKGMGSKPDFISTPELRFKHRQQDGLDIYFVANPEPESVNAMATFRVGGRTPELWWPDSGRIERPAVYEQGDGSVSIPLSLGPTGSVFVVFRHSAASGDSVVRVTRDGQTVVSSRFETHAITIIKADYGVLGDPLRTRDMRKRVQALVDAGAHRISVGRLAEGDDPAYGVVKTLVLRYRIDGQDREIRGQDPDTVTLVDAPMIEALDVHHDDDGRLTLQSATSGRYELVTASGRTLYAEISGLPAPVSITGPWRVAFDVSRRGPATCLFNKLEDWTRRSEPGIRYYSGKATYQVEFELTNDFLNGSGMRYMLDLGEVYSLATVRLNGRPFPTLWCPPWQLDVTGAVKSGTNVLEVDVVNTWNNRLVGDVALPVDQRPTFLTTPTVNRQSGLQPAGLLGPVTLRVTQTIAIPL